MLGSFVGLGLHEQAQVGGVGAQPALAGLEGIGQAFSGEYLVVEHAEAAAVQSEWAGIFQPESAQRPARTCGATPERNSLCVDFRLHDRNERGLIFLERNAIFEFVLKEIAESLATR